MAITEQKDPRTKKTFLEASGVVSGVYFNEIEADKRKTYNGTKLGQVWRPTHRINLVVDGERISLGMKDFEGKEPQLRCKDADDNWQDVVRGAEVSIVVTTNGEYNGKPNYQASAGDVIVTKVAPTNSAPAASGAASTPFQKKDMTGVRVGHAINVAMNVLGLADADELIEAAKKANDLTEKLRAEFKEKNPSMSDYDVGASVGQAVLSASSYVENVEDIEEYARQTLEVIAPAVTEYIKEQSAPKKEAKVVKTPAAKKTAAKKAAPAPKPEPEPEVELDGDFNDDIPF